MFYDDPRIKYENPPPPDGYEFDSIVDPPSFIRFHKPQRVIGVSFIKVDRNLVHKDLIGYEEKEAEQNITNDQGACGNDIEPKTVTTAELDAEGSRRLNISEIKINKAKSSNQNLLEDEGLKKKKEGKILDENESAVIAMKKKKDHSKDKEKSRTDTNQSVISKKQSTQHPKSSALESISKSYAQKSDSDSEEKKKSKSASRREKSHSKNSSRHRRKDKDSKNNASTSDVISYDKLGLRNSELRVKQEIISSDEDNTSKKTEISGKKEVLPDKDDNDREKIKSSKKSKKKKHKHSKNRYDDYRTRDRYRDDSRKKRYDRSSSDDSRKYSDDSRKKRYDRSSSDDSRKYSDDSRKYSDDDNRSKYSGDSPRDSRSYVKWEIKQEPGNAAGYAMNDFYCDVCKLILNSETTFSSHMAGKRHKKAVRLKSEQDVARSQIKDIEGRTKIPASKYSTPHERAPPQKLEESQSYPKSPDMERIPLHDEKSRIQEACDDAKLLIIGLDYVLEIRGYEETKYFCELCSAQCVSNTIIQHLTGSKHHINCVKLYSPRTYEWMKDLYKKDKRVDREIKYEMEEAMSKYGKGRIRVFKDKKIQNLPPEPYDPYQPSTSHQDPDAPIRRADELTGSTVTDEDCLSRDFSDFYCKVCDSHMNNHSMWESHARGKRHAKNKKKAPSGAVMDGNYIEAPRGTVSKLDDLIKQHSEPGDIIVGLNYIKENHGTNGDLYNCFLCGSVCPTLDIVPHLLLSKHKMKYLEKMHSSGYTNGIDQISGLPLGDYGRDSLIEAECRTMLAKFGRGKPVIAVAKK